MKYAPFANRGGGRGGRGGRGKLAITRAKSNSSVCGKSTECVINVYVIVLENDGNVLGAAITASSLTLAIAGIECHDLVLVLQHL